jgi:hypothetical protein
MAPCLGGRSRFWRSDKVAPPGNCDLYHKISDVWGPGCGGGQEKGRDPRAFAEIPARSVGADIYQLNSPCRSTWALEEVVADPIHFSLGLVDAQVLWLAAKEKGILLTGDLPLRQEAERRKLSVHGLLWILAQMVGAGKLQPQAAAKALRIMLAKGARLPAPECERLLREWEK